MGRRGKGRERSKYSCPGSAQEKAQSAEGELRDRHGSPLPHHHHFRCRKWTDGNVNRLPGHKENVVIISQSSAFKTE